MDNIGENIIQETRDIIWDNIRHSVYVSMWCNATNVCEHYILNEILGDIKDNIGVEILDNVCVSMARTFNVISPLTQKLIKEQIQIIQYEKS